MYPALRIIAANEPRSYREAMAGALIKTFPDAQVLTVDPTELDVVVAAQQPHFVLCSEITDTIRAVALTWIVLYPDGENHAKISIDGYELVVPQPGLDAILTPVHWTRLLLEARGERP